MHCQSRLQPQQQHDFLSNTHVLCYNLFCCASCCAGLQERNSTGLRKPVRLMERSVFSDRMVFVRAVRESGWMGDVELAVYDSWFGPILETNPSLKPDGFIYLKCDPSTCMERWVVREE